MYLIIALSLTQIWGRICGKPFVGVIPVDTAPLWM
jgi:hypothetical protein